MKINNGYTDSQAAAARDAARAQETAATQPTKAARAAAGAGRSTASDEVSLSSLASAVQSEASDSPERTAFLERLASEFAAGNYRPDPQATASGIVEDTLLNPEKPEGA